MSNFNAVVKYAATSSEVVSSDVANHFIFALVDTAIEPAAAQIIAPQTVAAAASGEITFVVAAGIFKGSFSACRVDGSVIGTPIVFEVDAKAPVVAPVLASSFVPNGISVVVSPV